MRTVAKLVVPAVVASFMAASMPAMAADLHAKPAKPAKTEQVKVAKVTKKATSKPAKTG